MNCRRVVFTQLTPVRSVDNDTKFKDRKAKLRRNLKGREVTLFGG